MSAEGTGPTTVGRASRVRTFRPAWSLAAGTGLRARVSWFAVAAGLALPLGTFGHYTTVGGFHMVRPFAAVLPVVLAAWIVWSFAARSWHRRAGERRRRDRDGAAWWQDRDWPASGLEHRTARGMRGPTGPVSVAVVALFGAFAMTLSLVGGLPLHPGQIRGDPEIFGWVPAAAGVVVAAWTLPLVWVLLVFVPRFGRGRLVVAWPELPQRTGARCTFHVGVSPGGTRIDGARVFLRCVRTPSRPFLPLANWNARLAWVAEARLPLGAYLGPQSHLRAEFGVPAAAPSTDLLADDTVRWELLVLGTVGGGDYADSVIVPVYAP